MAILGPALVLLSTQCAPMVHWETMTALVRVESAGDPFAVRDNTTKQAYSPKNAEEATKLVEELIAKNHSVDIGLAQINSRNLGRVNATVADLFNACKNLKASQVILLGNYQQALAAGLAYGQPALQAALSAYNTGSMTRGASYVRKVLLAANSPYPLQPFLTKT